MIAVGELPTKACVKSMHAFCFPVHGFIAIALAFGAYTDIHKYARMNGFTRIGGVVAIAIAFGETRRQ